MSLDAEVQCILILDLARDNPLDEQALASLLPAASYRWVYRVTEFGAEPSAVGGAPDRRAWRSWTEAVDRMLARAREDIDEHRGAVHYYVAGRASLPIFSYLGARLGKQARVTALNPRVSGAWDVVPFQKRAPAPSDPVTIGFRAPAGSSSEVTQGRFFNVVEGLHPGPPSPANGRVAVFVATQVEFDRDKVHQFLEDAGCPLAGTVVIRARPADPAQGARAWLTERDGPRAAEELEGHITTIKDRYPCNTGLIVFVAGPTSLALMTGWAINPRIYTPVWLPNFPDGAYEPAVEIPWPLVPGGKARILIATANPPGGERSPLDIEREVSGMLGHLDEGKGSGRCEHRLCMAAEVGTLMNDLATFQPHVLHFSGHGTKGGSMFRHESGGEHFVPMQALMEMLRATASDLQLIVLCSCHSTWQAKALIDLALCTVGTSASVLDKAAIAFSKQFYAALVRGDSVKKAFEQGKARAMAETRGSPCEFHLHHREGVDPGQVIVFSHGSRSKR